METISVDNQMFAQQSVQAEIASPRGQLINKQKGSKMNDKAIDVLKKVFTYGNATGTHLDILDYLNEVGIPSTEYSQWGKNKAGMETIGRKV